ncbi:LacI family DNA-binding transcriptional regulator [Novosphingobium sp. FSW06-99]|uniref:LacI family DNA-binding transcriptional regulator n=1 Tax=Novosphingobium sp. FSW06-99 TaxID=1739113 RepID=UPI00076D25C0|nr:LacI family DNA-binding transcriptional regulator [Novosphingobium sp. FSW06-99]KUR79401.1 LacI family transcriptional regulator [Novosphingobium sp. FSW06-99]
MADKKTNGRQLGRPTVSDVARLANCSLMTVSRVVNGGTGVRAETREAVEAAIKALNYAPNRAARSLASAGETRVALLYTNPSAAYLSELLIGCMDEASQIDAHIMVERCATPEEQARVIQRLVSIGIEGFLLPPPLCDEDHLLDLLRRQRIPSVLIGPGRAEAHHHAVMIDDYQAAHDMTRHIIALGHKRIGFVIGNPVQSASGLRLAGFRDAMSEAGLPVVDALVRQGLFTYRSGMDAALEMLTLPERPTAIFASNDDMAAGCIAAAQRSRLDVPGDLTVCGFDDTANASTIWPELTTIRQPISDMARRGLSMLNAGIVEARSGQPVRPQHVTLDYALIERSSDGPPPRTRGSKTT